MASIATSAALDALADAVEVEVVDSMLEAAGDAVTDAAINSLPEGYVTPRSIVMLMRQTIRAVLDYGVEEGEWVEEASSEMAESAEDGAENTESNTKVRRWKKGTYGFDENGARIWRPLGDRLGEKGLQVELPDWVPKRFFVNGQLMFRPFVGAIDTPMSMLNEFLGRYFNVQMAGMAMQLTARYVCEHEKKDPSSSHKKCKAFEKYLNAFMSELGNFGNLDSTLPAGGYMTEIVNKTLGAWPLASGEPMNAIMAEVMGIVVQHDPVSVWTQFLEAFKKRDSQNLGSAAYPVWVTGPPTIDPRTGQLEGIIVSLSIYEVDSGHGYKDPTTLPMPLTNWAALTNVNLAAIVESQTNGKQLYTIDYKSSVAWCVVTDAYGGAAWTEYITAGTPYPDNGGNVVIPLQAGVPPPANLVPIAPKGPPNAGPPQPSPTGPDDPKVYGPFFSVGVGALICVRDTTQKQFLVRCQGGIEVKLR